jgi:4-hydroxy-tetrahydrodipicolinate reductase
MSAAVRVLLLGAKGRMGRAISEAAEGQTDVTIAARLDRGEAMNELIAACDVVIDFSHANSTTEVCDACAANGKPLVLGTTGQTVAQLDLIEALARKVAVVIAPNFSAGANALFSLARKAAEMLGSNFDLEIIEMHHRLKKDAPSGTAKRLAEILAETRALEYERDVAHGRHGMVGERPPSEIGMHAVRGGDVIGEHTIIFAGDGERIELVHKASNRAAFALGALRAARWIVAQPAGFYSMEEVLEERRKK